MQCIYFSEDVHIFQDDVPIFPRDIPKVLGYRMGCGKTLNVHRGL